MSLQTHIKDYFNNNKLKSPPVQCINMNDGKTNIRRSLSLNKPSTSKKPPPNKDVKPVKREDEVIEVVSSDSELEVSPSKKRLVACDSEQIETESTQNQNVRLTVRSLESLMAPATPVINTESPTSSGDSSNSSATTFVYNLSPSSVFYQSPTTPSKSTSPGSRKEFYSPTRKKLIKDKSPAKRNLSDHFSQNTSPNKPAYQIDFPDIVDHKDDKTGFLVSIIHRCLNTESLRHLLKEESQVLLENCMLLHKPGMKLMCRLYWRQHIWYRVEDIYGIIRGKGETVIRSPDLSNTLYSLISYGLITSTKTDGETKLDFEDYVKLLKRPEIMQICQELKLPAKSKDQGVEKLRSYCKGNSISGFFTKKPVDNRTRVLGILKKKTGDCFKISELAQETFHNLHVLMYLGVDYSLIREKKLELMLIDDKIKREIYPIDKDMEVDDASVVFQDRAEFYRYLEAHKIHENYLKMTVDKADVMEKCEIIRQAYNMYKQINEKHMLRYKSLPTWLRKFTPPYIYIKMLEKGVQELKRLKTEEDYRLAVDILDTLIGQIAFRQHKKALWYAEKALILHTHLNSSEEAAKVLLQGFKDDLSEDAKDALIPRANKIANQKNIDLREELRVELRSYTKEAILESSFPGDHINKQPKDNYEQRGQLKFEAHTEEGKSTVYTEKYCLLHYVNNCNYTHGEHWEGRIASSLFFLLFWDIIYSKPQGVSGIFLNHYQQYPLDMFCDSFYMTRKTLIDERLAFIQQCTEGQLLEFMQKQWEERPQSQLSEVRQRDIECSQLSAVTSCLGAGAVSALCRRLATRYGYARSGFPDLTIWNINTKKIKFVEVKSDDDKPSVKQLQWLRYLIDNGIDAGFCYIGVNTTRSKARSSAASLD
uniref:Fanconi-associated nuclease n=1 Tax=Heliothis virescens TaxID=7102 RepID=A0A2A4KAH8_HELVI